MKSYFLPYTNWLHHTFDVLTRCNLENDVAVWSLHKEVFMIHLDVKDRTAVAALVGMGHILQNHPETPLGRSKVQPWR